MTDMDEAAIRKAIRQEAYREGMLRAAEIVESNAGKKPEPPLPEPYKLGLHRGA